MYEDRLSLTARCHEDLCMSLARQILFIPPLFYILPLLLALILSLLCLAMISTTVFAVFLSAIWVPSIYADSISVYANDTNFQLVNFISS